jgi:hypothetical protein
MFLPVIHTHYLFISCSLIVIDRSLFDYLFCFFFLNIFIQLFILYNITTGIPDRSSLIKYIYIASIGKDDKQISGYLGNLHVARDITHHKTYPQNVPKHVLDLLAQYGNRALLHTNKITQDKIFIRLLQVTTIFYSMGGSLL